MKKITTLVLSLFLVFSFSGSVFAANNVSKMAVNKGGQHVAQCAQAMGKGVSECVQMVECK